MSWTSGDLKLLALGMALGGKWNATGSQLPKVRASVPAGEYWRTFETELESDIPEAVILYSTDGKPPRTEYVPGTKLTISETSTVLAIAIKGSFASAMAVIPYVMDTPFKGNDEVALPEMDMEADETRVVLGLTNISVVDDSEIAIPGVGEDDSTINAG